MMKFISLTLSIAVTAVVFLDTSHARVRSYEGEYKSRPVKRAPIFRLVPTVGGNIAQVDPDEAESGVMIKPRTGITVGVLTEYGRSDFRLQSGLIYSEYGVQGNTSEVVVVKERSFLVDEFDMRLDVLTMPLTASYDFTRKYRFYAKGGIVPAYFMGGSLKKTFVEQTPQGPGVKLALTDNSPDNLQKLNVFGTAGLGFSVPLSAANDLRVEMNYTKSFVSIASNKETPKAYAESFLFTVGMGFGLL